MRSCQLCIARISDDARICPNCGARQSHDGAIAARGGFPWSWLLIGIGLVSPLYFIMRPAPSPTAQGDEEVAYWSPSGEKAGLADAGPSDEGRTHRHKDAKVRKHGAATGETEDAEHGAKDKREKSDGEAESLSGWGAKHQNSVSRKKLLAGAATNSRNRVYFAPPYDGGSSLQFIVASSSRQGANVGFKIDRGRMVCARSSDCYAMIRFDDGEPRRFPLTLLPNTLTDSVAIQDKGYFLGKARQARKIAVELNFDRQGREWFDFDVGAMRWPTKKAG